MCVHVFDLQHTGSPSSIWHQWVQVYKLQHSDIWTVQAKQGDSVWWKAILKYRDILLHLNCVQQGQAIFMSKKSNLSSFLYDMLWPKHAEVGWSAMVWNKLSPPRVAMIVWLICHNRLPVKSRLFKWGLIDNVQCVLCESGAVEDGDHLFGCCSFSQAVFHKMWGSLEPGFTSRSLTDFLFIFLFLLIRIQVYFRSKLVFSVVFLQEFGWLGINLFSKEKNEQWICCVNMWPMRCFRELATWFISQTGIIGLFFRL